jgi:Rrf2 family transcriptional regulator, iron-sulfur cluster assembly transcription factor
MMLTTRGRYAVMAMVDMASNASGSRAIALYEIANRQGIKLNYLEQIFTDLRKGGLVGSVMGPGGGYVLSNDPSSIRVIDVINASGEKVKMIRCEGDADGCMSDKSKCLTHNLWNGLGKHIEQYLASVTLQDLCYSDQDREGVSDARS